MTDSPTLAASVDSVNSTVPDATPEPSPTLSAEDLPTPNGPASDVTNSVWLAAAGSISDTLTRRGFTTTEFWTTSIGFGLTALLALVGVPGSTTTQVVSLLAPTLLAGIYGAVRTMHKSNLSKLLGDIFPQSSDQP